MLVHRLDGVGANLQDHPWCLLDVDALDPAAPGVRPVSGSLLRYELGTPPGQTDQRHLEAQIFPFQSQPYVPAAPGAQVSMAAALMAPVSRGELRPTPDGLAIRLRHLSDDGDARAMADIVEHAAALVDDLAAAGVVRLPDKPWWREPDRAGLIVGLSRPGLYLQPPGRHLPDGRRR